MTDDEWETLGERIGDIELLVDVLRNAWADDSVDEPKRLAAVREARRRLQDDVIGLDLWLG